MTWSGVSYLAADLTAVYGAALATAFGVIRFLEWAQNRPRVCDDIRLSDGSVLEVSIAKIRTGTGVEIEGQGYPPDVEVAPAPGGDEDLQLQRAIQIIIQRISRLFVAAA